MATPLYTPRVNNNDDSVRLVKLLVKPGDAVRAGEIVAEVETDKANFTVESDQDGYVLCVSPQLNQTIDVGSVLLWLGATADEPCPAQKTGAAAPSAAAVLPPTLKAAQLLAKHGLLASDVPAGGGRLTVQDVEAFLARGASPVVERTEESHGVQISTPSKIAPGVGRSLSPEERGMLRTVLWQRDEAVPGYVEIEYDAAAWEQFAGEYQKRKRLMLSPQLALMAYQLVRFAAAHERWNSTIVGELRHVYRSVNLGFTIQSDTTLYLGVVQDASSLAGDQFVERLSQLQRGAMAHNLRASDLTGATISFSSMARWKVTRHVPVLPPHTALIVAHAGARGGAGTLGATYDHRVLTGFDALSAIQAVASPDHAAYPEEID
jgi:pyruvate/2-oxoglutarate dehydrogenase complex dihydrolipoamide acyltransferase (E2) component